MDITSRVNILDDSKQTKIALIYSRSDLNQYVMEILDNQQSSYIHEGDDLKIFNSLDGAVDEAVKLGAGKKYMCLDNTYDECGTQLTQQRFSYLPL